MIQQSQISKYKRDGYLVVEKILKTSVVRALNGFIDEMIARSVAVTENDDMYDLEPGHEPGRPRVRGLKDPLAVDELFRAVSRSDLVLDVVEALVGPDIRHDLSFVNIKPAGGGSPVQWHQDWAILPYTNDDLVVCGLALTDSTTENGCLQVIPGSHRGPILDHHQDDVMIGAVQLGSDGFDLSRAVPVEVPSGGMSLHHFRVLHGSAPNRSDRDRRLYFLDYSAADAFPISKKISLPDCDERIVRGSAVRRARMMALEFPMPNRARKASVLFHLQDGLRKPVYEAAGQR